MVLKPYTDACGRARIRWSCPLCDYELKFHAHDADEIGFFVVRHLSEKHAISKDDILLLEPMMRDAVIQCPSVKSKVDALNLPARTAEV